MKTTALIKMTIHENKNGQILWIATGVAFLMVVGTALISSMALSHKDRLLDTASYFLIDIVLLVTALLLGGGLYARDFSNRGIAEIAIPNGVSRERLFLTRLLAHAICLVGLAILLFAFRGIGFWLADFSEKNWIMPSLQMLAFVTLKTILALIAAAFIGCHTRPVIALLGSLVFFGVGHISAGISGVSGISDEDTLLRPELLFAFKVLKIWNPNHLMLESMQGAWEAPTAQEFLFRCGWGISAILFFAIACTISVNRREIEAFQL